MNSDSFAFLNQGSSSRQNNYDLQFVTNIDKIDKLSTNMFDANINMEQTQLEPLGDYNLKDMEDTKSLTSMDTKNEEGQEQTEL